MLQFFFCVLLFRSGSVSAMELRAYSCVKKGLVVMKKTKATKLFQMTVLLLFAAAFFLPKDIRSYALPVIAAAGILLSLALLTGPWLISRWNQFKCRRFSSGRKVPQREGRDLENVLIRQISYQITDHLQAAYPEATWEFVPPFRLSRLLDGKPVRLATRNTGDYNFAEVSMDRYGTLHLQMMTVEALNRQTKKPAPSEEPRVDPDSWYSLIGKPFLINLVGDLQAKGYQKLYINEQGDVYILNGKEPEIKGKLDQFPPKDYWSALTDIFISDDLTATQTDQALELSWM